ncbi:hypothetical protein BJ508DRAFT_419627 [Ascobolus immersus RN42]|uniref:Uncharacterized protein n=1 Tax=Ascobolus immersus RN42 TaxID=1160509 RepID=A0A3N4HCS0_ASCIM|nr:hypothetical protein BJ508DRAFT_419627 [Ascobolus immersus RN42]
MKPKLAEEAGIERSSNFLLLTCPQTALPPVTPVSHLPEAEDPPVNSTRSSIFPSTERKQSPVHPTSRAKILPCQPGLPFSFDPSRLQPKLSILSHPIRPSSDPAERQAPFHNPNDPKLGQVKAPTPTA